MNSGHASGYKVFAALHEDTDKGWIWASGGKQSWSRATTLVTRKFDRKQRAVYCEYREIDGNFVLQHDRAEGTECLYFSDHCAARAAKHKDVDLNKLGKVVVISEWYRNKLGGFNTSAHGGTAQELQFEKPRIEWWGDLRAACQHPEPGVRVATRIAILGTWFGVTALLPAIAELEPVKGYLVEHCIKYPALTALLFSLVIGGLFSYAAWRES